MRNKICPALAVLAIVGLMVGCGGSTTGTSSLDIDFTLLANEGSYFIQGTVFHDLNDSGYLDSGEPGIEGVPVDLGSLGVPLDSTLTTAAGSYAFAVSAGDYTVEVTVPEGFVSTSPVSAHVVITDTSYEANFGLSAFQEVQVDVKPGSGVNPLNLKSNGVLPVAILGSEDFDVTSIDPVTILLNGVSPLRWSIEDICCQVDDTMEAVECNEDMEYPDGYDDLMLKFETQEIAATLGDPARGDTVPLYLSGELFDQTNFVGEEFILIVQVPK